MLSLHNHTDSPPDRQVLAAQRRDEFRARYNAGEVGLSSPHTSPQVLPVGVSIAPEALKIARGGNYVQLSGRKFKGFRRKGGGLRGRVAGFTRASRRRLMRLCQSIDQTRLEQPLPLFLTLTYGRDFPTDPVVYKRHLDTFSKALRRKFPRCFAIWRLEFQKRGAPHYHLLVFNVGYLDHHWLAATWTRIVSGDADHLRAGTEVRRVVSWKRVIRYASKYIAKISDPEVEIPAHVGRWWGVFAYTNVPLTFDERVLSSHEFHYLRRVLSKMLRRQGVRVLLRRNQGLSAFLPMIAGYRLLDHIGRLLD